MKKSTHTLKAHTTDTQNASAKKCANFVTRNEELNKVDTLVISTHIIYKHARAHSEWQNGLLGPIHDAEARFDQIEIARRFVYFLVLLISFYIVGFLLYKENGYQQSVPAEGVLAIKVKGTAATNETETGEKRVYDANDLVQYSSDGVFVATRLVKTMQAKGTCLGVSKDEVCSKGKNTCVKGSYSRNGRQTGKCLPSTSDPNAHTFARLKGGVRRRREGRRRVAVGKRGQFYSVYTHEREISWNV